MHGDSLVLYATHVMGHAPTGVLNQDVSFSNSIVLNSKVIKISFKNWVKNEIMK